MNRLKASICTGLVFALLLSLNISNTNSAPTTTNPKIVIVGAGPSGIAAAVKLLDHGFQDVTILEAEPRIGGRIHTIPFADNVVDLGAQWCHGEKNNVVYELAKDRNLFGSTMELYKNITFIRSIREKLPDRILDKLSTLLDEIMSKRRNNSIPINVSAHDFLKKEFDEALKRPGYRHINKKIAAEVLLSREYEECSSESSDNLLVIPAKGDIEYEECEGDQTLNWKDKGYKTILDIIMKTDELGKKYGVLQDHIKLSKKVKHIDWKRNDNKIMINCEDGENILADHVVITVSIGVLKEQHATLFEPALSTRKQAAIKEIDFGSVSKIFLEFDEPFWPEYWTGFTILWTEEDRQNMRGTENFWWEGVYGFYAVDYQPRILEVWLIGPSARHMETLNEDKIKADCVELIKRFLGWDIRDPINIVTTNWFTNPNFRGTYSYHSIKLLKSGITPRDLEEPLTISILDCIKENEGRNNHCNKPIVQFAGEATNVRHYSTVHGAIETGWREATRLAKFYGIITKDSSAPTRSNSKIVIIGAGPSGIAAAVKLLDHGFQDVTILEAEPRIGGRIHTIPFADNVVDLGAQWCHGEKNNVVYELAKDRNLFGSTMELYKNITFIRSIREKLPDRILDKLSTLLDEIMSKRRNNSIPINVSAHDFLKKEFDEALKRPGYRHINKKIAAEVLLSREYEECSSESSDNLLVIPAKGDIEYEECEGDQTLNWKDKGYKTILDIIMKTDELEKEYGVLQNHIKLSKKVKHVDWKRYDNKVLIDCEDGDYILADHVIFTVSIGVLKDQHAGLFEPALSTKKQAAIKEIDFGSVSKIFLEFDDSFWPEYWTGFTILWTEEDRQNMRGTENFWWEGVSGFYAVDYQPRILEVWLIGPSARHMETLNEDKIKADCVELIKRFLGWDIRDPINIVTTNWFTNPNFRGTYSYHSIKLLKSGITPRDLEEPLTISILDCIKENEGRNNHCNKPIVQFAGEATNVRHYSTVHGAIETGWREATRLAKFYGIITKDSSAPTISNSKIVIIGAGPSGIAAAVKLLDHGFQDVTILEAEPRIGGRIHTIPFADNVVDLGAQWCHGEKNNVVYELAKDRNLFGSTMELYKNITFIRSIREKVSDDILDPLSRLLDEIMSKRRNNSIPINVSAHDFLKKEFDEALARTEYRHINKKIAAEVLLSREYEECSLESSDNLLVIPAKGDIEYEECEGDQTLNWKDKGYRTILDIIMKTDELGKEYGVLQDHIKLSKKVKYVDWKRYDNNVMINCEDGYYILADHVIFTVSIGVLKDQHAGLFEPALPIKKLAAIGEIDFGSVSKIFLEFDDSFWPDYWTGFTILWTEEDRQNMRGTENFWWEGVYGFYAVDYQPRILEVWLIGPSARHMETLNEDKIKADCVELIKRFLGWDIRDPINIVTTNWFTNPNFRGTYSYHSIKLLETDITPRDLEEPLTAIVSDCIKEREGSENDCEKPIVQFAGEATNVRHYSTVHGAIETGWREANRLAEFYGINVVK